MGQRGLKRGKYKHLDKKEKALVAQKAAELSFEGFSMNKIAEQINVPRQTLTRIIESDEHWAEFLKKKQIFLKAKMIESIAKDLKEQAKKRKRAKFGELGLSAAIKWDKVWPESSKIAEINTGDRTVIVTYPQWRRAEVEAAESEANGMKKSTYDEQMGDYTAEVEETKRREALAGSQTIIEASPAKEEKQPLEKFELRKSKSGVDL